MGKDKQDQDTPATPATSATNPKSELEWKASVAAEDEISILWKYSADIENSQQALEAVTLTQSDSFWPQIESLADSCDEILSENGFPGAGQMVRYDGTGKWWKHPQSAPKHPPAGETWHFALGSKMATEFSDDFSDAWYAGEVGFKCRMALELYRKGDAGSPDLLSLIFAIASLRTDWRWRRGNKPSILTGRKQRKTLAGHRDMANEKHRQRKLARRKAIEMLLHEMGRNLSGGALERYLKKHLDRRFEINASVRTIRRDLSEILRP